MIIPLFEPTGEVDNPHQEAKTTAFKLRGQKPQQLSKSHDGRSRRGRTSCLAARLIKFLPYSLKSSTAGKKYLLPRWEAKCFEANDREKVPETLGNGSPFHDHNFVSQPVGILVRAKIRKVNSTARTVPNRKYFSARYHYDQLFIAIRAIELYSAVRIYARQQV